jgi:ubiquitin carboxyl-terminal hydrolase 47
VYQHDVQELFRVLIEALEKRWEKTPHKGCIENLFKGDIIDYIKCLKCGTFKSKPDIFLDLSLAIKADGEFKPYKSLEESLTAFTKPEILDGNNKYQCENCNSLEDAEKGLAIKQFPPILAIQLKRYGFDYNTLHRIKLNDRLTFPDYLDLNKFLYKEPEPPRPKLSYAQAVSKYEYLL